MAAHSANFNKLLHYGSAVEHTELGAGLEADIVHALHVHIRRFAALLKLFSHKIQIYLHFYLAIIQFVYLPSQDTKAIDTFAKIYTFLVK